LKILHVLQDWLHPPDNGQKLVAFNLLRYLSERHECHTIGFVERAELADLELARRDFPSVKVLAAFPQLQSRALAAARLRRVLRLEPPSLARYDDPAFPRALRAVAEDGAYDVVHFHIMSIAHHVAQLAGRNVPTVLSALDAYSMSYFRAARFLKAPRARLKAAYLARVMDRHERQWYKHFSKVHVVSDVDREYLALRNPEIDVTYVPFAISPEYLEEAVPGAEHAWRPARLLYSGWLNSPEVAQSLEEFLDGPFVDVMRAFPETQLTIIGRNAAPRLARRLESTSGVRFIAYAPDYLEEAKRATAFVYPFAGGSGVKTKILQAMALGRPVIASPDAFDGTLIRAGQKALVCGSPGEFREALLRLLADPTLSGQLAAAGREYVIRHHGIASIGARMEDVYREAIEKRRKSGRA
jgi:glycosyltransferase involved in cell wall biosynthesis